MYSNYWKYDAYVWFKVVSSYSASLSQHPKVSSQTIKAYTPKKYGKHAHAKSIDVFANTSARKYLLAGPAEKTRTIFRFRLVCGGAFCFGAMAHVLARARRRRCAHARELARISKARPTRNNAKEITRRERGLVEAHVYVTFFTCDMVVCIFSKMSYRSLFLELYLRCAFSGTIFSARSIHFFVSTLSGLFFQYYFITPITISLEKSLYLNYGVANVCIIYKHKIWQ